MIIDRVFLLLIVFFVTFSWLKYYEYGSSIAVLGGILLAAVMHLVINFVFKSKKERKRLNAHAKKQSQLLLSRLAFSTEEAVSNILAESLNKGASNYITKENGFLITKTDKTIFLAAVFSLLPVSPDFICKTVQTAKETDANEVAIMCCKADKNSLEAANLSPVKVRIYAIDDVYAYLKKRGCLPELQSVKRMRLVSFKNFGALFFHRSRAKVYLSTSIFLILFSYISMFKLYDLIVGSLLFLFSIYARFNKHFNLPAQQDLDF